ncbi:hypothetical protein [uncultured Phycicoccus sp.]|uniref:hypothetical protein n=1 Tax=uncultured Phycicoccus sp. TaxID=661422 RepID=UPI00260F4A56|nr:hypothetical protein [uncultured Phycicoccus sp.]
MTATQVRHLAEVWSSSVDKHSVEGEIPIRLCNYTDAYKNDTVEPHAGLMRATATPEEVRRFRLQPGDTVLTKDSEDPNDIGISAFITGTAADFVCGYHLAIARPREGVVPRFLNWAFRSRPSLAHFSTHASGISRYGLGVADLRATPVPVHDLGQQQRIADFLDDRVARIDQIIVHRQEQAALTDELAQAQLSAVFAPTEQRGRLKDLLAAPPCYGVLKPEYVDAGTPIVRIADLPASGSVEEASLPRIPATQSLEYIRTRLARDDVLLGVVGTLGRPTVVHAELVGANVSRAIARLRPRTGVAGAYVQAVLRLPDFARFTEEVTHGTAQSVLNMGDLKNYPVPLADQNTTTDLLAEVSRIDSAHVEHLGQVRQSAALLREYKQSLITAAVTGEFDVTTAGSGIPG